ncbi:hypothetical protein OROHE_014958 [Orobanche hederae]
MDASELEEVSRVFQASLLQIKWRVKPSSKSRLQTDLVSCHCKQESSFFELLHVMVIDDMVYLIQVRALADFIKSSLSMETALLFLDLENDPPKMMTQADKSSAMMQLLSAQKLLSSAFHADRIISNLLQSHDICTTSSSIGESQKLVDLSCCLQESHVTIPTLNGCELHVPTGGSLVTRSFICSGRTTLSRLYIISQPSVFTSIKFMSTVVNSSSKGYRKEELMSFTVPYELSMEGSNEPWAESFLAQMKGRWENNCKHVWESLHMEVIGSYPQAVVL